MPNSQVTDLQLKKKKNNGYIINIVYKWERAKHILKHAQENICEHVQYNQENWATNLLKT